MLKKTECCDVKLLKKLFAPQLATPFAGREPYRFFIF